MINRELNKNYNKNDCWTEITLLLTFAFKNARYTEHRRLTRRAMHDLVATYNHTKAVSIAGAADSGQAGRQAVWA